MVLGAIAIGCALLCYRTYVARDQLRTKPIPIRRLVEPEVKAEMSNANDDKSPLIDLLTCIVCKVTMKIANSSLEAEAAT